MDITYISEFITLINHGNFSNAAVKLNMSQPTLSKHIQALEAEIGGQIIYRTSHGVVLTPLGEIFMKHAQNLNYEYERMEYSVEEFIKDKNSSFSLGVIKNLNHYDVVGYLVQFRKRYPDCTINVIEAEDSNLKSMINEKKLNLATVAIEEGAEASLGNDVHMAVLGRGDITAVLPESFKGNSDTVSMTEICKHPLIVPEQNCAFSRMIKNTAKSLGLSTNVIYEGSSAGCLDFTKADMGVTLQSVEIIKGCSYPGMRTAKIEPRMAYCYGLAYRDEERLSMWEKRFVNFMRESFEKHSVK